MLCKPAAATTINATTADRHPLGSAAGLGSAVLWFRARGAAQASGQVCRERRDRGREGVVARDGGWVVDWLAGLGVDPLGPVGAVGGGQGEAGGAFAVQVDEVGPSGVGDAVGLQALWHGA